jgi:general secretion pathway protein D
VTRAARAAALAAVIWSVGSAMHVSSAGAQQDSSAVRARGDSVSVRLIDVDVRAAVQALAQYLDRPVVFGGGVPGARVTFETPQPVPRADVPRLLRGLLESQSLELVADSAAGIYRVQARAQGQPDAPAAAPPQPAAPVAAPELFVIKLRHARAADVAATVNALFGRASALGELGARPSTLSEELRENQVPPQAPGAEAPQPVPGTVGRVASLSGETTIVPDAATNSLLVRANRPDFELITAAVRQLDVRPLQVLIEVLIAEVRRDRSFAFGVEGAVPLSRVPGVDHVQASATQNGIGLGDFALRVLRQGPGLDFDATLRAAAARGDAKILSRPIVIAANNEPAEILVGSQRPFVQVQRSLPTDAPSRDQVVQYKDVGTRLVVRPTISADGYVALEVTQEVNAATSETQFDAPVISTRTVRTRLLVRDSQTVVLGGLSDRQRDATQGGVPVLSSVPILGGLFGRASRRTTETEFFLFLTPRVLRTDAEAEAVTQPYEKRARRAKP